LESDDSRKKDDESNNDELESLESPNKKTLEHTSVNAKTHGKKQLTILL